MHTLLGVESIFGADAWLHGEKTVYLTIESNLSAENDFFFGKSTEENNGLIVLHWKRNPNSDNV